MTVDTRIFQVAFCDDVLDLDYLRKALQSFWNPLNKSEQHFTWISRKIRIPNLMNQKEIVSKRRL